MRRWSGRGNNFKPSKIEKKKLFGFRTVDFCNLHCSLALPVRDYFKIWNWSGADGPLWFGRTGQALYTGWLHGSNIWSKNFHFKWSMDRFCFWSILQSDGPLCTVLVRTDGWRYVMIHNLWFTFKVMFVLCQNCQFLFTHVSNIYGLGCPKFKLRRGLSKHHFLSTITHRLPYYLFYHLK